MTPVRRRLLDRMLDSLLDLDDGDRAAKLDHLGRTHPRLHAHLARLAAAADPDDRTFATVFERIGSAALSSLNEPDPPLPSGTRVGDWQLIEPIGQGGMGQVYRAERADGAFEMQAAIKFIRTSKSRRLAERLTSERRLLARLDHPGIARLLDGGTLDDGRGYLVMEWIDGVDLTEGRERLMADPETGIRRFAELAAAVAHAHQRQVVHGDIKPANVRLTPEGSIRLLDFGVARLVTDEDGTRGLAALTPAFSAPEQLVGEPASTQSDLYALGALLRWLLTGAPGTPDDPADPAALRAPRPEALAAVLDRAMRAEPGERYRSVPEFSDDLLDLLARRPIRAQRAGPVARLALWARRHRLAASLAGLTTASVIVASIALAWQAGQVRDQRDAALREAERLALLREQMVLLFRDAGRSAESEATDPRGLLGESVALAEQLYADDPETRTAVQAFLGEIYIALDDFEAAEPLLESVLAGGGAGTERLTAFAEADLAQIRLRQGDSERALELADQALGRLRQESASSTAYIADTLQIRGQALRGIGQWDAAVETLQEAYRLARRLPGPSRLRATTANNLATTMIYMGRTADALPYLERALANWRGLDRADNANALTVMGNLASLLHQRGELSAAEALYRETLRRRSRRYGESGALAAMHLNLGSLLALTGRIEEAERQIANGLTMIERFEGSDSVSYTRGLQARARLERTAGRTDRALRDIERALERYEGLVGRDHLFTSIARLDAARIVIDAGDPEGFAMLDQAVDVLQQHGSTTARFRAEAMCHAAAAKIERNLEGAGSAAGTCLSLYQGLDLAGWQNAEARLLATIAGGRVERAETAEDFDRLKSALGSESRRVQRIQRFLSAYDDEQDRRKRDR